MTAGTDATIVQAKLPARLAAGTYTGTAVRRDNTGISWTFTIVDCAAD